MNFTSSPQRHRLNRAAVNLSSMIDVTFLLLIYFLVTTVLTPPEDLLAPALNMEDGTSMKQEDLEPQIVKVELLEGIALLCAFLSGVKGGFEDKAGDNR